MQAFVPRDCVETKPMGNHRTKQCRTRHRVGSGLVLAVCLVSGPAVAQVDDAHAPTSTFDTYGNARPRYLDRRSVGLFQNDAQRRAFRGYQDRGRRINRRGGFSPFSLAVDRRFGRQPRSAIDVANLQPFGDLSASRRSTSLSYGGFGRRTGSGDPGDISTIFTQQRALIAATALNAPLHRAFLQKGTSFGLRSSIERTPFVQQEETGAATPAPSLDQRLRTGIDLAHKRIREEARRWFQEGQYRSAARAYETVIVLEPSDSRSRISEIFCHLLVGQVRTALAVFGELNRRDDNVFLHELNLIYGDAATLRQLRIEAQLRAGSREANPDFRALHILVLWHLGKEEEAIQAATALARGSRDKGDYADWVSKMRAALTALASDPPQGNEGTKR